jgi:4-oxalocrotonate tautomerase
MDTLILTTLHGDRYEIETEKAEQHLADAPDLLCRRLEIDPALVDCVSHPGERYTYVLPPPHSDERWIVPIISVKLIKGRTPEQKAALIRQLGEGAMRALAVPEASVRVILTEIDAEHWGIGTESKHAIERKNK